MTSNSQPLQRPEVVRWKVRKLTQLSLVRERERKGRLVALRRVDTQGGGPFTPLRPLPTHPLRAQPQPPHRRRAREGGGGRACQDRPEPTGVGALRAVTLTV